MKTLALAIFGIVAAGLPASAQQTSKQAKIDQILALTNAKGTLDQVFVQMRTMMASNIPSGATPEVREKLEAVQNKMMDVEKAHLKWEIMRPHYAKIYEETYSGDEIDGLLAFYQTKAGRALIEKNPLLTSKMMTLTQTLIAGMMPELQQTMKDAGVK